MTKKKDINQIAKATANKLLALVCQYYGFGDITQLAASERLSSWRYSILEEARQIACLVLQRHCELEPEGLQVVLEELGLDLSSVSIRMNAGIARRKYAEDHMFRIGVGNIEQMILITLIGKSDKIQPYAHLRWKRVSYIKQGKPKKGRTTKTKTEEHK